MSFASESSKLLTNKYFLYFMVFLSATNVLGYLVTNKLNAVIFFALVSLLTYQFSKNMAVILLISIIATNFMMSNKMMREGMDNATPSTDTTTTDTTTTPSTDTTTTPSTSTTSTPIASALENVDAKDPEIAQNLPIVQNSATVDELKEKKQNIGTNLSDNANIDMNNLDLNNSTPDPTAPEGFSAYNSKKGQGKTSEHFGPRLDYAATIEQSYQNLDSLLGSDSIKQLTGDTQKLMQQQQNLFNTMNQMVPVLEGAQNMLKGFDMSSLTNSLKGMSTLVNAPTAVDKKSN
jgi:cytoskeletal protein RodZ